MKRRNTFWKRNNIKRKDITEQNGWNHKGEKRKPTKLSKEKQNIKRTLSEKKRTVEVENIKKDIE